MSLSTSGPSVRKGSLVIVGTGIQLINHVTHEAHLCIKNADKVVYAIPGYPTRSWIETLNANTESLERFYEKGKPRAETYKQMVEVIMNYVRGGFNVCAVFYGHPGVFVSPSHESIKLARNEGYEARMLPGISAEDCLFADLGVDPGKEGCQSFEATDFLIHKRRFDPSSTLILWQVGVIGILDYQESDYSKDGIKILAEVLKDHYGTNHRAIIYEASSFPYPIAGPSIQILTISELPEARITQASTLYIPPKESLLDYDMLTRLNLNR
jgi:precorrin-6B methylase 1